MSESELGGVRGTVYYSITASLRATDDDEVMLNVLRCQLAY